MLTRFPHFLMIERALLSYALLTIVTLDQCCCDLLPEVRVNLSGCDASGPGLSFVLFPFGNLER